jgi:hypothetical protein
MKEYEADAWLQNGGGFFVKCQVGSAPSSQQESYHQVPRRLSLREEAGSVALQLRAFRMQLH